MTAQRKLTHGELLECEKVIFAVDELACQMNDKWGTGRLPLLCGSEWAAKFARQQAKFSEACQAWNVFLVREHGAAMERAYRKLDELAEASGQAVKPADHWEFQTPDGLVILVKRRGDIERIDTQGRRAAVWSLDEIEEVIRKFPVLSAAKAFFPGAEVIELNPGKAAWDELNDNLENMPF